MASFLLQANRECHTPWSEAESEAWGLTGEVLAAKSLAKGDGEGNRSAIHLLASLTLQMLRNMSAIAESSRVSTR